MKEPVRILCTRPDNMGDVLMTTPAIRALKNRFPDASITLLTSSAGKEIGMLIPEIDDIMVFDVPWMKHRAATGDGIAELVHLLQNRRFDLAIVFTVYSQNPLPMAMVCYMAQIPRTLGYCRENPYHLLTGWVPDPEVLAATRHEVVRQLDLVSVLGAATDDLRLSLDIPLVARELAIRKLAAAGVDLTSPWIVMHTGVSEEKRRYPPELYAAAGKVLAETYGLQLVLTGSGAEQDDVATLANALGKGAYNLAGSMDVRVLGGLLAESPLLIANNTGPVHMAAAVGTPVVVLYAKTNPQHTPWQVENTVLYFDVPASLRTRNSLLQHFPEPALPEASPEEIINAAIRLLEP